MKEFLNKVIHGDCRDIIKDIPKVDFILTDPPYGIEYNAGKTYQNKYKNIAGDRDDLANDYEGMNWLKFLFERPEKKIIFGAENFYGLLPHRGRWICWDKRVTEERDKVYGGQFELAWSDADSGFYKIYRVLHAGVINADSTTGNNQRRFHPTQKPVELMMRILLDFTKEGDIVLDPFLGSGTTALACKRTKRNFIGIEIEEKYCKIANSRLRQEVLF